MVKLYSPRDLAELALIESILEGENIPYFIHNDQSVWLWRRYSLDGLFRADN